MPCRVHGGVQPPFDGVVGSGPGLVRLFLERHAGLGNTLAALSVIALTTCRNDVVPNMLATTRPGDDMIDGQVRALPLAILTGVVVADENLPP